LFRIQSATAWTTLALTINADGSAEHELVGASPFPRHWIYDDSGELTHKSGTVDFKTWYREAHGERTPWGEEDSAAVVAAAETELERRLSAEVMGGEGKVKRRSLKDGETLVEQGEAGSDLYLILDGVLVVERDGEEIAEVGPGAIVGEMALLEERGARTATLRARTPARVAVLAADAIDREALETLAAGRATES
jgi:mannose-6-phosphate isomerase-like protein (cupin superfamily)